MKVERIRYGTIKDITSSSLIRIKFNQYLTMWYSYNTPVAVEHHDRNYLTNESYSRTTGMHMREIVHQWGNRSVRYLSHLQMQELVRVLTRDTGREETTATDLATIETPYARA